MQIDFNCDMGEGMQTDDAIIPYISSANIACGYHAGNADTMKHTIELCLKHNVMIGAHPSFLDPENFGRKEMDVSDEELYELIMQQLSILKKTAEDFGTTLYHIKPHGALYNMAGRDKRMAKTIASAVHDFDPGLILYGLSGSYLIKEANEIGLKTANEVFADRSYQDDGSLTPRSSDKALIKETDMAIQQALMMATENKVISINGKTIPVKADTICIHGDGPHAISFAKTIHQTFSEAGISIKHL